MPEVDIQEKASLDKGFKFIHASLSPLYDSELDTIILGRSKEEHKEQGSEGLLNLGFLAESSGEQGSLFHKRILVDALYPHIIYTSGKRGSGKSYTLSVLAEELVDSNLDVGIVIVDPIGIFWSMKEPNQDEKELEKLQEQGLSPKGYENVKVLVPDGLKNEYVDGTVDNTFSIRIADVSVDDWCAVFGLDRFKPQGLAIEMTLEKIRKGYKSELSSESIEPKEEYSLHDIIKCIEESAELTSEEKDLASMKLMQPENIFQIEEVEKKLPDMWRHIERR